MADENVSNIKETETCLNAAVSKEQEVRISKTNDMPKPQGENSRRHSTGAIGTTKPKAKSRYRGNHQASSTHDFCKYGKRCDQDDAVKPWNMVKRKSVEAYVGGSAVKSNDKARKKREKTQNVLNGSGIVKKVPPSLRNDKSNTTIEKVSRITDGEISKVCAPKNKEKANSREGVKEKNVCVVESSIKSVHSDKQSSTMRSVHNILTTSRRGSALTKKTDSCEIREYEKVALRHPNVEGKKKMVRLLNHVIEETMSNFTRKNKVNNAFETVISVQDTNTSHKVQSNAPTSASMVSPLVSG